MIVTPEHRGRKIFETLILTLLLLVIRSLFSGFYISTFVRFWTLILCSLSLFSPHFLSTIRVGIYLFNFVSSRNSRCFLIGGICTLSDVRVRALCCELSGALDSAPSSSSVSQVASDKPECEWRGTQHTPPDSRWTETQGLYTFGMKSNQSVCPSLVCVHWRIVISHNLWSLCSEWTVLWWC